MSEIEVVVSEPNQEPQNDVAAAVIDIYSASAYGDIQKLRKFVEEEGASVTKPDGNGYYALQWAALNNFSDIAHYIIEVLFLFSIYSTLNYCSNRYVSR